MLNRQMNPILQLPMPSGAPFDFSQTAAPSVREIFPEPPPKDLRTFTQKLMELRVDLLSVGNPETIAKTDALLFECADIEQRINGFLADQRQEKLKRLEAARGELWTQCRALEDALGAHVQEVGRLNAISNGHAANVSAARAKVQEAVQPPFATRFPNEAETEAWNGRLATARGELAKALEQQQQINLALSAARALHAEAARELAGRVEALRAADSERIEFQKKQ